MLTLLQEVAQVEESKIDWNEMVKKTTTGITNAREYQMVWRHLAYRQVLLDKVDDDAQPLVSSIPKSMFFDSSITLCGN